MSRYYAIHQGVPCPNCNGGTVRLYASGYIGERKTSGTHRYLPFGYFCFGCHRLFRETKKLTLHEITPMEASKMKRLTPQQYERLLRDANELMNGEKSQKKPALEVYEVNWFRDYLVKEIHFRTKKKQDLLLLLRAHGINGGIIVEPKEGEVSHLKFFIEVSR